LVVARRASLLSIRLLGDTSGSASSGTAFRIAKDDLHYETYTGETYNGKSEM
jgi:hypothetical protein